MNEARVLARGPIRIRLLHPTENELELEHRDEIDRLWLEARAARPGLYDGLLLSVVEWASLPEGADVAVCVRRYRTYVAQREGLELGVRPLGVSGACEVMPGSWLAGRRSSAVTDYPGCWELVPSGSLEPQLIEPLLQLRCELAEETGIAASVPAAAEPLGLVVDDRGIFDIALCLRFEDRPTWTTAPTEEYDALMDLDRGRLEDLVSQGLAAPTMAAILALLT